MNSFLVLSFFVFAFAAGNDGLTPLHIAAGAGDTAKVEKLIKEGADVLALDPKMGVSVLHKAVYSGNAAMVDTLLKNGALVNLQSPSNGDTPMHDAIYFRTGKDLALIQTLLKYKPALSIKNRAGFAPVESARLLKQADVVKILEDYEANRQSAASRKLIALIRKNNVSAARKMIEQSPKTVLEESDDQGFTPLLWSAREGYVEIVKLLLARGANPNQKDQWMGANSGHKAAFWGRDQVMEILVGRGLELNARGDYNGYTALHDAVAGIHFATAEVLMKAGADPQVKGHDGKTASDIAVANGDQRMIALLKAKAAR